MAESSFGRVRLKDCPFIPGSNVNQFQAIPFQIPEEDWGEGNPGSWAKYDLIIAGRFINGIGCGVATCISPMMLTEIAPLPLRGIFGTQYQFL